MIVNARVDTWYCVTNESKRLPSESVSERTAHKPAALPLNKSCNEPAASGAQYRSVGPAVTLRVRSVDMGCEMSGKASGKITR